MPIASRLRPAPNTLKTTAMRRLKRLTNNGKKVGYSEDEAGEAVPPWSSTTRSSLPTPRVNDVTATARA